MIKVASAILLLLGSGLIFRALVAMDAPAQGPRPLVRWPTSSLATDDELAVTLPRAA